MLFKSVQMVRQKSYRWRYSISNMVVHQHCDRISLFSGLMKKQPDSSVVRKNYCENKQAHFTAA